MIIGGADSQNSFQQLVVHAAAGKRFGLAVRRDVHSRRLVHIALHPQRAVALDGSVDLADVLRFIGLKFLELRGREIGCDDLVNISLARPFVLVVVQGPLDGLKLPSSAAAFASRAAWRA